MDAWRLKCLRCYRSFLTDEHVEHASDAYSAREAWNAIVDVFERYTLLKQLAGQSKFYAAIISEGEKTLPYKNRVKQLGGGLKSMNLTVEDKYLAMEVSKGFPSSFEHSIVALDAIGNEDSILAFDFVKSQLLREEQRSETHEAKIWKSTGLCARKR